MTTRFSVTITTSNTDGGTKASECSAIVDMLERIAQQVGSGRMASGTVMDRNSNATGSYTYTATASA